MAKYRMITSASGGAGSLKVNQIVTEKELKAFGDPKKLLAAGWCVPHTEPKATTATKSPKRTAAKKAPEKRG